MSGSKPRKSKKRAAPIVLPLVEQTEGGPSLFLTGSQSKHIQELVDLLKRNNLTELELERDGIRIRLRHEVGMKTVTASVPDFSPAAAASQAPTQASAPSADATGLVTITSPIVGTFYRSPSPDADPYVEEGDFVRKGQVLCIVEAMKLMNEIESEVDGRIVKILAESTKPVEYGQALFHIDPKATA
ncbi:Biotin carboxyl carrier protein of acetyl-CoA carboxylase [Nitrospira sp. KM1]|uniref:acetyl-CoA carboxylase biotin carboxyl carrier protein n=1 Tax=Nitrospira sp. KM1 TaxID=1936990 RepID=UPI0013A79233|nr:acetyl-CoA carboxylase biotin carboxyl carrier protein [Nitrospira sp. KM1]BCA53518.1 Biotin carboxyl carrier protein of acetyl-CoA carboxylase [Nitrospira sp. KM1]